MLEKSTLVWGLILIIGFPLLVILLGEGIERLRLQKSPWTKILIDVRGLVMPMLALVWLMERILGVASDSIPLRTFRTLLCLAVIYTTISLLNTALTAGDKQYQWQIHVPNLLFLSARGTLILGIGAYILAVVWQFNLGRVATAFGIGSLVIALALQDTLSNLVSGFLLMFEQPFKIGDWVRVGEIEGQVVDLNWRATRLKTRDRDIVIIPNGILGKDQIYNYTLIDPLHAERIFVNFSYDDPPNRVRQVLLQTALGIPGILAVPQPDVRTKSYNEFSITYEVKFYIVDFKSVDNILNSYMTSIYYAVKRSNFTIPYPIQKVQYTKSVPTVQDKNLSKIIDALKMVPSLDTLEHTLLETLAKDAIITGYGTNEKIVKIGQPDLGLYLILEGKVQLSVEDNQGHEKEVMLLFKKDIFGEMALLPGEISPVSAKAMEDSKVVILAHNAVNELIAIHSPFALAMSHLIEERRHNVRLVQEIDTIPKDLLNNQKNHSILRKFIDI